LTWIKGIFRPAARPWRLRPGREGGVGLGLLLRGGLAELTRWQAGMALEEERKLARDERRRALLNIKVLPD